MKLQIKDSKHNVVIISDESGADLIADNINHEKLKRIVNMVNAHEELIEALKECSPLIDGLINRTPSGKQRNELTDINIKVKTILEKDKTI